MDPLSLAAGAAGIISLAIEVTRSLVTVYDDYKNQNPDVAHMVRKLDCLSGTLESLQSSLNARKFTVSDQGLLKTIQDSVQHCEEHVDELQLEIRKLEAKPGDGFRAAARTAAYKTAYPLRKSTLVKLEESTDEIISHLSLALQVLQNKDVGLVWDEVEGTKELLNLVRASQISFDIRQWLKAPDVSVNYNEACNKRHPRTGQWFVGSNTYQDWLTQANSFLWLYGFAGCGKSVLCSTAITHALRHRRSNPRVGIAFFYFSFSDISQQDTAAMLRSLVLQLSGQLDNYKLLERLHQSYRDASPPRQAMFDCLHELCRSFEHTYILIDALDECPFNGDRDTLLQTLLDMHTWAESGLHLLVTSRDEVDIRQALETDLFLLPHQAVALKNQSTDSDIRTYISERLKSDRKLQRWKPYHLDIEQALCERADGIYRWVDCHLIALGSQAVSKRQLDSLLACLPRGLDATYEHMLSRIDQESLPDTLRVLKLLCCAARPLSVSEVVEAVAIELGHPGRVNPDARFLDGQDALLRLCPGMIELWENTTSDFTYFLVPERHEPCVRLAHFSVQEYLESDRIKESKVAAKLRVDSPEVHDEITRLCLTYLEQVARNVNVPEWTKKLVAATHPFAGYATWYWWFHADHSGNMMSSYVAEQMFRLFSNPTHYEAWASLINLEYSPRPSKLRTQMPASYAAMLGMEVVVMKLLFDEEWEPPARQAIQPTMTPEEFKLFLFSYKNLSSETSHLELALYNASGMGHESLARVLLDRMLGHGERVENGAAILHETCASKNSHKMTEYLLSRSAHLNLQQKDYDRALVLAAHRGSEATVKTLLAHGADVNTRGGFHSALSAASSTGNNSMVILLLDRGAKINMPEPGSFTPLQAAVEVGLNPTVQLLLDRGAHIDEYGWRGNTALSSALKTRQDSKTALLVNHGANINYQPQGSNDTALQIACNHGSVAIVRFLLDRGAHVNTKAGLYGSALQAAAASNVDPEAKVRLLLDHGADPNAQGGCYGNTLRAAAAQGSGDIVRLLLDRGACITEHMDLEDDAIKAAKANGREGIVQLLLYQGRRYDNGNAARNAYRYFY